VFEPDLDAAGFAAPGGVVEGAAAGTPGPVAAGPFGAGAPTGTGPIGADAAGGGSRLSGPDGVTVDAAAALAATLDPLEAAVSVVSAGLAGLASASAATGGADAGAPRSRWSFDAGARSTPPSAGAAGEASESGPRVVAASLPVTGRR
jgi:hypothetical protein